MNRKATVVGLADALPLSEHFRFRKNVNGPVFGRLQDKEIGDVRPRPFIAAGLCL